MTEYEARLIMQQAYGELRIDAEDLCFEHCCIQADEKQALLTLIYGETP